MLEAKPSDGGKPIYHKNLRLRYRGEYDYDGLMTLLRGFFVRARIDIEEPVLKFKESPTGAEVEFKFRGDRRVTNYIKVYMYITGHFWDVVRKEVVINGKKKLRSGGKIELTFQGEVLFDYEGIYEIGKTDSQIRKIAIKEMKKFTDEEF
ncbi:MAG: hypothetical protein AB7V77_00005, partial [Candidatus Woesearchaeota archaeon]